MSIRGGSSNSLEIEVRVDELIGILRTNREKHVTEYNEQIIGWRKLLGEKLVHILEKLGIQLIGGSEHAGVHQEINPGVVDKLKTNLYKLPTPISNEVDYTRTIWMLEMHQRAGGQAITLEAQDYARYVDDDWDWKETFLQNSVTYGSVSR